MDEQEIYDAKRRGYAEEFVRHMGPLCEGETDPTALVGGMILAAAIIGMHYELGDVFELVGDDLQRDIDALESGEWRPQESDNGE